MCYNKNVSIITFCVMIVTSIILLIRNKQDDRWFGVFFIFAGLMQLAEYFMWIDQKGGKINHYATLAAFIILLLQPLSLLIGGYYFGELSFDKKKLVPIIIVYIICFGLGIFYGIKYSLKIKLFSKPDGKHLSWAIKKLWISNLLRYVLYILYYLAFLLLLFSKDKFSGILLFILYFGTLFFSVFFVKNSSWKSFWCWIVNMIPVIYLIVSSIRNKKSKDTYYE